MKEKQDKLKLMSQITTNIFLNGWQKFQFLGKLLE